MEEELKAPEQELSEDLLSIITVFVAKNNGLRSGKNKRRRKKNRRLSEDTDISHKESEEDS